MGTVRAAFNLFLQRVNSMQIDYTLDAADDLPLWVVSDRHRLMQVLVNLLGNAIKFTHQGAVVLQVKREAEHLRFTVSDTGIGIVPERLQKYSSRSSKPAGPRPVSMVAMVWGCRSVANWRNCSAAISAWKAHRDKARHFGYACHWSNRRSVCRQPRPSPA